MAKRGRKPRGHAFPKIFSLVCNESQHEYLARVGVKIGPSSSAWAREKLFSKGWEEELLKLRAEQDKIDIKVKK